MVYIQIVFLSLKNHVSIWKSPFSELSDFKIRFFLTPYLESFQTRLRCWKLFWLVFLVQVLCYGKGVVLFIIGIENRLFGYLDFPFLSSMPYFALFRPNIPFKSIEVVRTHRKFLEAFWTMFFKPLNLLMPPFCQFRGSIFVALHLCSHKWR